MAASPSSLAERDAPSASTRNDKQLTPPMQKIDFQLDRDYVELNQLLKLVGLCDSGGAGKAMVASGAVSVDGATELRKTCKIRQGQVVAVDDVEIHVQAV